MAAEAMCEVGHSWKLVSSQDRPVELGSRDNLSKADHEALNHNTLDSKNKSYPKYLTAAEQELLAAAAEKSLVTILPKASQGEVNCAIGALAAIAPCITSFLCF